MTNEFAGNNKRIFIFTGHYGSGKTEISINFALQNINPAGKTALIDLDFINPYFRSREAKALLEEKGISVIASAEEYFNTDVPAFSPQISGYLKNKEARVIMDLGGDETGARAAGRFRNQIVDAEYQLYFVVNPFRPFTSTPEDIKQIIDQIQAASRLQVSALVSNPNLLRETTVTHIVNGHHMVVKASQEAGVPIAFLAVETSLAEKPEIKEIDLPVLKLDRQMVTPWE